MLGHASFFYSLHLHLLRGMPGYFHPLLRGSGVVWKLISDKIDGAL
jgi:hypothetical protein